MTGPAFTPPKWRKPADVRTWWPEMTEVSVLEARLREEQAQSFLRWEMWALWTRAAHGAAC